MNYEVIDTDGDK